MSQAPTIIYTKTDEAPALATYSLLPIIEAFTKSSGIAVETRDISLAGRILAAFADRLPAGQQVSDDLAELGSEAAVKAAGKLSIEGKGYVVQDGDVMHFRFNV